MLNKEQKRLAYQRIEKLRKNPTKVTRSDWIESGKLIEKHKADEAKKEKNIKSELKDFSKDLSGYVHNHLNGVGQLFHGIGQGRAREIRCSFCERHESTMHNTKDGKWYCTEHRWFGNLTEEQKQKERVQC